MNYFYLYVSKLHVLRIEKHLEASCLNFIILNEPSQYTKKGNVIFRCHLSRTYRAPTLEIALVHADVDNIQECIGDAPYVTYKQLDKLVEVFALMQIPLDISEYYTNTPYKTVVTDMPF